MKGNPHTRGFTLIELLIAIAILTIIFSLGVYLSLDAYRGTLSRSDRDTVVSLLERARSRAMANINQTPWGVCYINPNFVVFQGTACTAGAVSNETTAANPGVTVTGLDQATPVVFAQLSGTTTQATIVVTEQGRVSTTTLNYEGAIIW